MSRADEAARRETLRVQVRLDALVAAIGQDGDGRPRPEPERRLVLDAARSALDRLADPGLPAAPPGAADATLLPETIIANTYAVRERIGRGGLAEIYRVRHRDLRGDHAAKILRPDRALDPVLARLHVSEARALMGLSHPAIPRARDLLRHGDGRAVIVMDLLRGETLAETLRTHGPLPPDGVAALARRLAGALAAVHAAGLVHGDVSPENVMLCGGAEGATLIDFGVVRRVGEALPDVEFAGKWSVAAPEQLAGRPGGPPADLYALGLLLAAASRGERVGLGRDRESALAARASLPDPRIDGRLGKVVRDLLRQDPGARPDAEAVMQRLSRTPLSRLAARLTAPRGAYPHPETEG
ncbi:protein kinase domain-containing protein [Methylobacterium indicum]|uniref:protein kinase domain-containing protein n=2 Tax=Methylobacterium indicum TaxID=1775910 RepID=UPI002435DFDA|nr:protein kinase [Methylobacterium indicum]